MLTEIAPCGIRVPLDVLAGIRSFGYSEREAAFLFLVASHSGHFVQRQYLEYRDAPRSGAVTDRLVTKALRLRHVRASNYGSVTSVRYHLVSHAVYGLLGNEASQLRLARRTPAVIALKLMGLDFVLARRSEAFLATEAEKVAFFSEELGIALARLPGQRFGLPGMATSVLRRFPERFPICVRETSVAPEVTFAYIHEPSRSLASFSAWLDRYTPLFAALPGGFKVVFVSATPHLTAPAQRRFEQSFRRTSEQLPAEMLRYFDIRRRWEAREFASLTGADLQLRVQGLRRYIAPHHEVHYQEWLAHVTNPALAASGATASRTHARGEFASMFVAAPGVRRSQTTRPAAHADAHASAHMPVAGNLLIEDELAGLQAIETCVDTSEDASENDLGFSRAIEVAELSMSGRETATQRGDTWR